MDITKEIWKVGKQEMEKLIKYVKEIGLKQEKNTPARLTVQTKASILIFYFLFTIVMKVLISYMENPKKNY
jgi:hypothetical protein